MRRYLLWIFPALSFVVAASPATPRGHEEPADAQILVSLASHQYNLESQGRTWLRGEAGNNDFFLLGELHGDNEIPALLKTLWPAMWKQGYRHIAAEVSPWAAHQLEVAPAGKGPEVRGLWTKQEAVEVHAPANPAGNVLWGCDMEEEQPEFLIRALAALNPGDSNLEQMVGLTKDGYDRKIAPRLLDLATKSAGKSDEILNDISVGENLLATLRIEARRLNPDTKMTAQSEREQLMKEQFLKHFRRHASREGSSKILFRFGRNHLHRGYDARGISTLGNFMAEFAISLNRKTFNVGAFGAGGKAALLGSTWDADERPDELAFSLLAEKARYPATLFDLRPLRPLLHRIPQEKRTQLEVNLTYWADAYDALICYRTVTPRAP